MEYIISAIPIKKKSDNDRVLSVYNNIYAALQRNGYPSVLIPLVAAQALHETNYGLDSKSRVNNWSGIKSAPGVFSSHRQYGRSGVYVAYPSIDAWAKDLKVNYLSKNKGFGRPLDSSSYIDYAKRLKANGYFTDSLQNYTTGIKRALDRVNAAYSSKAVSDPQQGNWKEQGIYATFRPQQKPKVNTFVYDQGSATASNQALVNYMEKQRDEQQPKKDFWDVETWSTKNKVLAGIGVLAAIAIITKS